MWLGQVKLVVAVGDIQLFAEIKRGDHGATYRGLDAEKRVVLVKTFTHDMAAPTQNGAAARFEQEAAIYAQIDHPNVARAIDTVIQKTLKTGLYLGIATGFDPVATQRWVKKGIQWLCLNTDYVNLFIQSKAVLDGVRKIEEEAG